MLQEGSEPKALGLIESCLRKSVNPEKLAGLASLLNVPVDPQFLGQQDTTQFRRLLLTEITRRRTEILAQRPLVIRMTEVMVSKVPLSRTSYYRGAVLEQTDDLLGAVSAYREAIAHDPHNAKACYALANLFSYRVGALAAANGGHFSYNDNERSSLYSEAFSENDRFDPIDVKGEIQRSVARLVDTQYDQVISINSTQLRFKEKGDVPPPSKDEIKAIFNQNITPEQFRVMHEFRMMPPILQIIPVTSVKRYNDSLRRISGFIAYQYGTGDRNMFHFIGKSWSEDSLSFQIDRNNSIVLEQADKVVGWKVAITNGSKSPFREDFSLRDAALKERIEAFNLKYKKLRFSFIDWQRYLLLKMVAVNSQKGEQRPFFSSLSGVPILERISLGDDFVPPYDIGRYILSDRLEQNKILTVYFWVPDSHSHQSDALCGVILEDAESSLSYPVKSSLCPSLMFDVPRR